MPHKNYNRRSGNNRPRSNYSNKRKQQRSKENIHPSKFISKAKSTQTTEVFAPKNSFADFNLSELILNNLLTMGINSPSPIQDQTLPLGLSGQDVIGTANTGTGKTIAFAVPVSNKIITDKQSKAIIIAPTRELASQIEQECKNIARGSGIYGALLIGGSSMAIQLRDLRINPQIVIGTPGRIKDHIERGSLNVEKFNLVVLDEVDRMLDMGFVHDMRQILGNISGPKQSFFFSATVDRRVGELIKQFSIDPQLVSVKTGDTTDMVEQNIVSYSHNSQKVDKLHDLLVSGRIAKALVFDDTQRSVERLSKELCSRGFMADAIHGGKSQGQRQRALKKFKASEINVLVATDVAARGIDVKDISHVINFSTPQTYDDYIHRIGRAGRAGKSGYALTFVEC